MFGKIKRSKRVNRLFVKIQFNEILNDDVVKNAVKFVENKKLNNQLQKYQERDK